MPCLGHCDLAPVVLHGDDVRGGVTHSTNGFLLESDDIREPPTLTQDEVIARLEASGLTGIGGAGFRPGASGTPSGASRPRAS